MRRLAVACALIAVAQAAPEFNRDIRPILSDKCFGCHGPDATTKKIPLRLDVESIAKSDLGGRRAIVPGDPANSELIKRVTSTSKARKMPPIYSGHTLTEKEITTLREWIANGGSWQPHWAFLAPSKPSVPAGANPIDYFIRQRLQREGLQPSAAAPRETLARRAAFDLTGLPPDPADFQAYLSDQSPKAWERYLDRLLASPRYGERMASRWLDWARYADSNGYQADAHRDMWRWRDYVIDSYNRNKPFDRFLVEQIAGDLLPNATVEQKIATGFNRNHRINAEDGIIAEEYAVEYVVDRVDTMSQVFLGLTLGCARCHNHKYDPFTQKEFYQLFAYFNNVPERGRGLKYGNSHPYLPYPTPEQSAEVTRLERAIEREEKKIAALQAPALKDSTKQWRPSTALVFEMDAAKPLPEDSRTQFEINDRFTLSATVRCQSPCDGPILTRMEPKLEGRGYGLLFREGHVVFHLTFKSPDDSARIETVAPMPPGVHRITATYDGSVTTAGMRLYIDGNPVKVRTVMDDLFRPLTNNGIKYPGPLRYGNLGDSKLNGEVQNSTIWARALRHDEIVAMDGADAATSARYRWLETQAPAAARAAWNRLNTLRHELEKVVHAIPTVMVMEEQQPRKTTFVLTRGEYDKHGEPVQPGVPASLPPLPSGAPNNRLGLAQWMVSRDHPLVSRVAVNRIWQMLFGTGIVKTTEDFGQQGEWPSHPELLDWLAVEFMDSGWNVKAMLKRIMLSDTYQQHSKVSPELLQRDPENRLLARGPRVRLSAEAIRDQALFVSGLLKEKLGGPSVKPYQPAGLWKEMAAISSLDYEQDKGDSLYRRSLYTFWRRTVPFPMMINFDAAQRETCQVRESRTNTPLQALNLMNDVTFLEASRHLAQYAMRNGLEAGFRRVLLRDPKPSELEALRDLLSFSRGQFSDRAKAEAYLRQGESPLDPQLDPVQLAAYTTVANLLLNLDEAVTKQ
jgi:hypothetical protein